MSREQREPPAPVSSPAAPSLGRAAPWTPSPPHLRMDLDPQAGQILSLDQIRSIRASNDYVDRVVPLALEPSSGSGFFYVQGERYAFGGYPPPQPAPPSRSPTQPHSHLVHLSRSSTISSSLSRVSAASDQRLLAGLTPSHSGLGPAVHSQPKGELKAQAADGALPGKHLFICERCGRCKCGECCAARRLPSCWACGGRCLCSAESALEYVTCLCCVKALFYHCSAQDEEEQCADRPCSCSRRQACARWSVMGLLALCLPCLCCYPPARSCLSLCQCAHDRATRPGCRCGNTNTVCRKVSASSNPALPLRTAKSLEKAV
ncbi:protein sprouty homolog 3 [Aplochiton taeniatus]